ncbi:MAG TPA: hypothetical protein VMP08_18250 [Anaerolineae bacterium]|nr:hypothetical protein [Anaerolineae bacterium]
MKRGLFVAFIYVLCVASIGLPSSSAASQAWQLFDGPRGGSVAVLAMSPDYDNDHTIFAGLRNRGVYRSIDVGQTWQLVGLSDQVIVDLAISPHYAADRTLFAAVGLAPAGFNIYRSTDGGVTWQLPFVTPYAYGFKPLIGLSISPDFASDHTLYALNGAETYKSSDGGLTFSKAGGWFASHTITSLVLSPNHGVDHTMFAGVQNDQLYKSIDGGAHWNPAGLGGDVMALALSPTYPTDHTLAVVVRAPNAYGSVGHLRVSSNDGAIWNDNTPWPLDYPGKTRLLFSPTFADDRLILASSSGSAGLFRSTDGGQTWTTIDQTELASKSIFALAITPDTAANPYAFLGTSSGMYYSFDRGVSWYPDSDGLPRLAIRRMAIATNDPNRLLVGTSFFQEQRVAGSAPVESDSNLQLSLDGGQTWRDVSGRVDQVQQVAFSPDVANDQIALACVGVIDQQGNKDGGILRSSDAGTTWNYVYFGARCTTLALSPNFAIDHTAWAYFSAGTLDTGIFRSVDGGTTWTLLTNSIVADLIAPSSNYAIDHTLFAATQDGRLQRSIDGGLRWTSVLNHPITTFAVSPAYGASQTLYAAAKDSDSVPADLYRSLDAGITWQKFSTGIPPTVNGKSLNIGALDFAVDGSVIAGVTYGDGASSAAACRSIDGGSTWQLLGSGLENGDLLDLTSTSNSSESDLHGALSFYAGTHSGLWRIDQFQRDPTEPGAWESSGPIGGRADTLALSPNFANDGIALTGEVDWIKVSDYGRGLFKSSDWGQTWRSISPSLEEPPTSGNEAVHEYAFSPGFVTDKTVFAATSHGLYKSTDKGDTWQWLKQATPDAPGGVTRVMLSPDYPTSGHLFDSNLYGCLSLSQDYGQTWAKCVTPASAYSVQYSPNFASDNTIFASGFNEYRSTNRGLDWTQILTGTSSFILSPNYTVDHIAFTVGAGISKTIDNGMSWTPLLSAPVNSLSISPQFGADQTLFGSGDANSNIVYRSISGGATWLSGTIGVSTTTVGSISLSPDFAGDHIAYAIGNDGLYRSTNSGVDWSLSSNFDQQAITSLIYAPDWPTHPYLFVTTDQATYRSIDSGTTWLLVPDLAHIPIESVLFSPGWPTQPYILIGSAQGIYRSTDGGATWSRMSGYTSLSASALVMSNDDAIWLTGTSNGLYASTDHADNWAPFGAPRTYIYQIAASPAYAADHTVFVEGSYGGMGANLLRTTDGGATWQSVRSMSNSGGLALSPQYTIDHTLFVLSSGVWRSTNGGDNWQSIGMWPDLNMPYRHIALPSNYPDDPTIFAAGPGFWRLPPGESMWQPAASGLLSTTNVSAIAVSPNYSTSHTLLAATIDYSNINLASALLRSEDGGVNWLPSDVGLPQAELRSIAFSPNYAADHTVYLVSPAQLYRSIDDGHRWTAIGAPPGWPELNSVAATRSGQVIVASSTGVWRYTSGFRDILIDGDFEAGNGWELIGNAGVVRNVIFSGQQALHLGLDNAANISIDSAAIQTVTIPVSATLAQLNLRAYPVTSETQPNGDAQYATVTLLDTPAVSRTLLWTLSNAQAWQRYSFDLTTYAGKTIVLRLGVLNDGSGGQTALYIDNASLITLGPTGRRVYLPVILKSAGN